MMEDHLQVPAFYPGHPIGGGQNGGSDTSVKRSGFIKK